jgi:hypothetical protein
MLLEEGKPCRRRGQWHTETSKRSILKGYGTGRISEKNHKERNMIFREKIHAGMDMAARHIRQLKDGSICDGVHIVAIGMEDKVPLIMERAGLL